jgi:signal transduction histidine kinase
VLVFGIAVAFTRADRDSVDAIAGTILVVWSLFLALRPHRFDDRDVLWWLLLAFDTAITILCVAGTGGIESPYLLSMLVPIALVAYTAGRREIVGLAAAGGVTLITIFAYDAAAADTADGSSTLLSMLYLLAGVIGSFARRLVTEMREHETAAMREVERLGTANELLQALHAVAQTLPSSFDLGDVVDSIRDRLRAEFDPTTLALLVRDEATGEWRTELCEGAKIPGLLPTAQLPPTLVKALAEVEIVLITEALGENPDGVSPFTRSALYAPLRARDETIGLLAIEHRDPRRYDERDVGWLEELRGPLALALDNARWFRRLRQFAAAAERARIARDLHDRLAQSLAYVGFELERLSAAPAPPPADLAALHSVVRDMVIDLRETLYELRAKVTEERSLPDVAEEFCRRLADRSGMRISFSAEGSRRLPLPVEQELWLIVQEAMLNAEHHSGADHVAVSWLVDDRRASLEVLDAGRGFDTRADHGDHYGLVGMRERADAIGAQLVVDSRPGSGTSIRVDLVLEAEPA